MININGKKIGDDQPPFIIAEMSANHNGQIENAFAIMDMAKRCGADAIKIQTYTANTITLNSNNLDFKINTGLWAGRFLHELYEEAHMPWDWHVPLFNYAKKIGMTLFSTPFDSTALELLEKLDCPAYKIASFECIDLPLIRAVAQTKKPVFISTGMANEGEICEAVETALHYGTGDLVLMHCVSGYPAPAYEYNLKTIQDMKERFGVIVGLSDHTLDNVTAVSSVALGASAIEKHVTLNRHGGGPDDSFSLEENELAELCRSSHTAWNALGKANYKTTQSEKENIKFRRSLYFVSPMKKGDVITVNNIRSVRPGYGLPPKYFDNLIGTEVLEDIERNTPVLKDKIKFKEVE